MKLIITTYIILLAFIEIPAQDFIFKNSIGDFKHASSLYINPAGIIIVTDDLTDEVYQLDTLGNLIKSIGGYGWNIEAFDDPVDVFSTALNIYVTDKNNHRIQSFDKNLNFIFEFYKRESENADERFGYPESAVQSNQGDVIILDSENKRILKFNIFGDFIQTIGSYDYGEYTLSDPKRLAVSMKNDIYVLDDEVIFIYDNYGTPLGLIEIPGGIVSIRIIFQWLTINSENIVYLMNTNSTQKKLKEVRLTGYDRDFEIVSSIFYNSKLYLLTHEHILIFSPSFD
jgi:hypothetical protein